jgi:hypothetical protein
MAGNGTEEAGLAEGGGKVGMIVFQARQELLRNGLCPLQWNFRLHE